ncbi:MAG: DUF5681 domain-containing protein [Beijerinckiaceae bacterium]|nr:DUF5681 domain-containing protein [Beijerinckiaceae bacterium]MCZ8299007.1 DUF5681 domain-containing protein [Beijerinckiaceae bacterium]
MKAKLDPLDKPVGYKKPPLDTRFQKGKSGNPAGRPKGSVKTRAPEPALPSSLDEIRRRHVATPVRIRDGDGARDIHIVEALQRQIEKLAFAGGIQAARLSLERAERTLRDIEAEYRENLQWVDRYADSYAQISRNYAAKGEPVPDSFARPEDIFCSRDDGLRIIGPYTERGLENYHTLKNWRDAMHVKMIYDQVTFCPRPGDRTTFTMAEFFVLWIDRIMPKRWRLDAPEMKKRTLKLTCLFRPALLRELEDAFRLLGFPPPLSKPLPPMPDKHLRAFGLNPREVRRRFTKG